MIVSDEPQPSQKYLLLTAQAQKPYAGGVTVLAPLGSTFAYGALLQLPGTLQTSDQGGDAVLFSPKIVLRAKHKGFFLREWMINLKLAILDRFNELLSTDEAALLGGITFGSKQNFKPDLKQAMSLSGLTHLVAISGYNITIVIFAAGEIFGRWFSRRMTLIFTFVFLILFMFMVGNAASGIRAVIMGSLALVAREMGEVFSMRNAVAMTALVMALYDPTVLTGNMSFILSFLSLLGIVYLGPPLQKLLRYEPKEKGLLDWKESAVTTFSAQLAVMPILINTFGQFSATAIIANVLVLGTVPLTMFFGFVLAASSFISSALAFFAATFAGFLLSYQLAAIRFFGKFAIPLPLPLNSEFAIFFYYLLLGIFIFSYGRTTKI